VTTTAPSLAQEFSTAVMGGHHAAGATALQGSGDRRQRNDDDDDRNEAGLHEGMLSGIQPQRGTTVNFDNSRGIGHRNGMAIRAQEWCCRLGCSGLRIGFPRAPMLSSHRSTCLVLCLFALAPRLAEGQQAPIDLARIDPQTFHAMAARLPKGQAPKIDGRLDDAVWEPAPVQGNFIQREPSPGARSRSEPNSASSTMTGRSTSRSGPTIPTRGGSARASGSAIRASPRATRCGS